MSCYLYKRHRQSMLQVFFARKHSFPLHSRETQTWTMNFLLGQQRSRSSDSGQQRQEEFSGFGEGAPGPYPQQRESFNEDYKSQSWFSQFMGNVSEDYHPRDTEFAAAVAAAALAINSLEEAEFARQRKIREDFETSRTRTLSRKDAASRNKSMRQEPVDPIRRPSRTSSRRPSPDAYQNQMRNPSRQSDMESRVIVWEKTEMEKIKKRYDKTRSRILQWESERKMEARLKMEKREHELAQKKAANRDHYRYKISRIDQIAGGARTQVEEKKRHEESQVKKEVKKFRSTGKVPVKYFCFSCY